MERCREELCPHWAGEGDDCPCAENKIRADERQRIAIWLRGHSDNGTPVRPSVLLEVVANTLEHIEEWPK